MFESNNNEIIIEEKPEIFKKIVKFIYTGSLDMSNNLELIHFFILSNKYLITGLKDLDINQKDLLNSVISYVDEDVDGRYDEFELLIEFINLKKVSKCKYLFYKNKLISKKFIKKNHICKDVQK
jgi:hypothetical protein